jgi:hypothetical protein
MAEMPDGKKATFAIEEIFSLRIVGMTAVPNVVLQERSGSWSAVLKGYQADTKALSGMQSEMARLKGKIGYRGSLRRCTCHFQNFRRSFTSCIEALAHVTDGEWVQGESGPVRKDISS